MDVVQTFNHELHSLLAHKPPISKTKMGLITRAAMRGVKFYKHIVRSVEKFVAKCRPEHKVPGLYVIDSIVRQSRHQFGADRDVFAARFTLNINTTFDNLLSVCPPGDKSRIVRVLNLWEKNGVFELQVIRSLLDMAAQSMSDTLPRDPKSPSSGDTSNSTRQESLVSQQYNHSIAPTNQVRDVLKFSKSMLDFDYGDENGDADETPTEAEPPLSSTLSKLEMEQRPKRYTDPQQASHRDTEKPHLDRDPVLERWNRIWKGDLTTMQPSSTNHYLSTHRSRSRSPTANIERSSSSHLKQHAKETPRHDTRTASDNSSKSRGSSARSIPERSSERDRKGLPRVRDLHLTVCSSTLWLGHVPRSVTEADISDAFGELGTINSIDLIPPRGCAYICMDRRQDAKRALREAKHLKLKGSHIKMAWAPGKGLKEHKKLKDFWEADVGASFIPYTKIDDMIDFDRLEEGGMIDEDSMSTDLRMRRERKSRDKGDDSQKGATGSDVDLPNLPIFNQPPPSAAYNLVPPPLGIPPPLLVGGQGIIPFPPPGVNLTSSDHIMVPPSAMFAQPSDSSEPRDHEFNPTEHHIGILDRQLGMLQQGPAVANQNPGMFYPPNPQNPILFDPRNPHAHVLHMINPLLDPNTQMAMLDGQTRSLLMGSHPPMTHLNQGNLFEYSNLDEHLMKQGHRDF